MNGIKIFFAWGLTVIAGSVLAGLLGCLSGQIVVGGYILFIMLVFSTLCSLPTLITLQIVNHANLHKSAKARLIRVNITHVIMFLLTVFVGNYYLGEGLISMYTGVVVYYAVVAGIVWAIMIATRSEEHPVDAPIKYPSLKSERKDLDF